MFQQMSARVGLQAFVAGCSGCPSHFYRGCGDLPGTSRCCHAQGSTALLLCTPRVPRCLGLGLSLLLVWGQVFHVLEMLCWPAQGKPETAQMQFWQRPPRAWGQAADAMLGWPWVGARVVGSGSCCSVPGPNSLEQLVVLAHNRQLQGSKIT